MTHAELWDAFFRETGIEAAYEAWAFGCDADELAGLVLEGKKTATAGLHLWYERENLELPREGSYSVVLDSKDNALCVIRTTRISVTPFREVGESHAWKEGEGDRSLDYWRRVHRDFFSAELSAAGLRFDPGLEVVCEEFVRVFP